MFGQAIFTLNPWRPSARGWRLRAAPELRQNLLVAQADRGRRSSGSPRAGLEVQHQVEQDL
jgi:hypothetical protein